MASQFLSHLASQDGSIEFSGVYLTWVFKYIDRHFWRFSACYDREDLVQEAAVKFYYCKKKYGENCGSRHFMSLFKTAVRNHFHDLATSARISNSAVPWMDHMGGIELHDGEGELSARDLVRSLIVDEQKRRLLASVVGMTEQQLQSMLELSGGSMSQIHPFEIELCQQVGMEPAEDRSYKAMQEYMKQLVEAVDSHVSDDAFDQLSDDAQAWVNAAVDAVLNDRDLPDFSDVVGGGGDAGETRSGLDDNEVDPGERTATQDPDDASSQEGGTRPDSGNDGERENESEQETLAKGEDKTAKPAGKKKAAGKKKTAGKKKAASKKEPKPRKKTGGVRAKEIMLQYGIDLSKEQIHQMLMEEGFKMSPSTVDVVRYEFRQAVRLLADSGMLRPDANIDGVG